MAAPKFFILGLAFAKLAWTVKTATLIEPSYKLAKKELDDKITEIQGYVKQLEDFVPESEFNNLPEVDVDNIDTNLMQNTATNVKHGALGLVNHKMKNSTAWYLSVLTMFLLFYLVVYNLIASVLGLIVGPLILITLYSCIAFLIAMVIDPLRENYIYPAFEKIRQWVSNVQDGSQGVIESGRDIVTETILAERNRTNTH